MKLFSNIFSSKKNSIYKSIAEGNIQEICEYLKSSKTSASDFEPESILHYAIDNCKNNYDETIKFLINNCDDINNHHSKYLDTPLHKICERVRPNMPLIRIFLEKRADVNAKNISGKTPIFGCYHSFSSELINLLSEYGADVNMKDKYGNTVLHDDYLFSDSTKFEVFLEALIKLGFNINARNSAGYTPRGFCKSKIFDEIFEKHGGIR